MAILFEGRVPLARLSLKRHLHKIPDMPDNHSFDITQMIMNKPDRTG